ncbi:MAG TPA: class I SAM-dependent methyltransferase, partial [Solirubrobacteraceae bacterium]|nr:class I SAM-dependent methyltransferase [Solirubrobacteraceae bacterium]
MIEGSLQDKSERLATQMFLGGPKRDFEQVGRLCLEVLLRERLRPSSRVLDVGCGALRVGYWLMRFLDTGCYYGIEPNRKMLETGLEELVEPEVVERAGARFAYNDDFDLSVFGEQFDFVLARSIWTHASKVQIRALLSSFTAAAAPEG